MPIQTQCPECFVRLLIRDDATGRLTCPRCLARLPHPSQALRKPMRVLPLDEQVKRDWTAAQIIILAVITLAVVGLLLLLPNAEGRTQNDILVFLSMFIILGLIVFTFAKELHDWRRRKADRDTA